MVTHAGADFQPLTTFMPSHESLFRARVACQIATAILSVAGSYALQSLAMSALGLSFSWIALPLSLGLLTGGLFTSKIANLGSLKIGTLIWIDLVALFFLQTSIAIVPFTLAAFAQSPKFSKQMLYQCISRGWTGVGAFMLSLSPQNDRSYLQRAVQSEQLGSIALLMFEQNINQSQVLAVVEEEAPKNRSLMRRCMVGALDQDLSDIVDRYLQSGGVGTGTSIAVLAENYEDRITHLNPSRDALQESTPERLGALFDLLKSHISEDWIRSENPLAKALFPKSVLQHPGDIKISCEEFQSLVDYAKLYAQEEMLIGIIDGLEERVLRQIANRPGSLEDIAARRPYVLQLIEKMVSVKDISFDYWVNHLPSIEEGLHLGAALCKAALFEEALKVLSQELGKPGCEEVFLRTLTSLESEGSRPFFLHLFRTSANQFERYLEAGISFQGSLFGSLVETAQEVDREGRLLRIIQSLDHNGIQSIVEKKLVVGVPVDSMQHIIAQVAKIRGANLSQWVEDAYSLGAGEVMGVLVEGLTASDRGVLLRATCLELDKALAHFIQKKEVVAAIAQMPPRSFAGLLLDAALNYPVGLLRLTAQPPIKERMPELKAKDIVPLVADVLDSGRSYGELGAREARDLINTWMEIPAFQTAFESDAYEKGILLRCVTRLREIAGMPRLFSAVFAGIERHQAAVVEVMGSDTHHYRCLEEALLEENYNFVDSWAKAGLPLRGEQYDGCLLHGMVARQRFEGVQHLIKLRINTQVLDSEGKTPLQRACDSHNWQIATHLAACEPASKDQTPIFQQVIGRGALLNQQLCSLREAQRTKESERNALDPDGLILTAVTAYGAGAAIYLVQMGRGDLAQSVFGWLRLTAELDNVALQEDLIRAELLQLEFVLRTLAYTGCVYRGGPVNVVSEAIAAGLSASVIKALLHHGGSLFARNRSGQRPIDHALYHRGGDEALLQVLSDAGLSGIEGVRERTDHAGVRLWRMIRESEYVEELDEKVIRSLEGNPGIRADAVWWKPIVTAAIEKGSEAIFKYVVAMLCEDKGEVEPTKIALSRQRYDRVACLAKCRLHSESDMLQVLQNANLEGLAALGLKKLPKGYFKALLSSTSNLEARLALLGEFLSGLRRPERLCRAVAAFLERTLPKQKRDDGESWLTPKDFKHYHSILLAVQPRVICPQSEEELRESLRLAQEPTVKPTTV